MNSTNMQAGNDLLVLLYTNNNNECANVHNDREEETERGIF
jgi:hypothetical protein